MVRKVVLQGALAVALGCLGPACRPPAGQIRATAVQASPADGVKAVSADLDSAAVQRPAEPTAPDRRATVETDASLRKAAVERLTDQATLAKVAQHDEDPDVRLAAVQKLTDQAVLTQLALPDEPNSALKPAGESPAKPADPPSLTAVNPSPAATPVGVPKPADPRPQILSTKASAPSAGPKPAGMSPTKPIDPRQASLRRAAVAQLTDQATLAKVARNDPDPEVRLAALKRLTDQAVLTQLALPGESVAESKPAGADALNLANLPGLAPVKPVSQGAQVVASQTTGPVVPYQAGPLPGIQADKPSDPTETPHAVPAAQGPRAGSGHPLDQAALFEVATQDKDWSVRTAAVAQLTHQAYLAHVATTDADVDIRKLAVSLLTDQAALARVATMDKDWSVRLAAVEKLTGQGVLAKVATMDADADIRRVAVGRLTDQAALARVARCDKDWSVRSAAVTRLTDRAVLGQVAKTDADADIRKLAVSRLSEPDLTL